MKPLIKRQTNLADGIDALTEMEIKRPQGQLRRRKGERVQPALC